MKFSPISMDSYARREHYLHYSQQDNCTYSVSIRIDVSKLRDICKVVRKKFYPAMICIVASAVNSFDEFKMARVDGILGIYDVVNPSYLIFHNDDKTFSCCNTEFDGDCKKLYDALICDMDIFAEVKGFSVKPFIANSFAVSTLPWIDYSSLNINVPYVPNYYSPIITWGKFDSDGMMTLTVQIDHAVADGYHTSMLVDKINELLNCI